MISCLNIIQRRNFWDNDSETGINLRRRQKSVRLEIGISCINWAQQSRIFFCLRMMNTAQSSDTSSEIKITTTDAVQKNYDSFDIKPLLTSNSY
jgi:hypothetical protein